MPPARRRQQHAMNTFVALLGPTERGTEACRQQLVPIYQPWVWIMLKVNLRSPSQADILMQPHERLSQTHPDSWTSENHEIDYLCMKPLSFEVMLHSILQPEWVTFNGHCSHVFRSKGFPSSPPLFFTQIIQVKWVLLKDYIFPPHYFHCFIELATKQICFLRNFTWVLKKFQNHKLCHREGWHGKHWTGKLPEKQE